LTVHELFADVRVRTIGSEEIARFARPGRDPLQNLNTPEDLERTRQQLEL
jgi:hypothetical protein